MEMSLFYIMLSVILVLLCVATVTMILLQKKRDAGFGGSVTGQGGQRDAYYDANKGRTMDGMLERYTKVAFVFILAVTILITIVQPTVAPAPMLQIPMDAPEVTILDPSDIGIDVNIN